MSRVLAALDTSAASRPVLATALVLGSHLGAEVEVVHVLEDGGHAVRDLAAEAGVPFHARTGPTVAALVAAASEPDVVTMVLGARATETGRRPAGRVALAVVTQLDKPVVVVPPHLATPGRLERVLVPLDDTRETAEALRETIEFARGRRFEVVVLHVHEEGALPLFEDQPQHELESWAQEFLARNCPGARELRLERRVGSPADQLLDVAREADVDLIALGWSRRLDPGRAAVVRETLAESHVSLMLVSVEPS
jgi:nucleotide-binding universal stress UspA family protein